MKKAILILVILIILAMSIFLFGQNFTYVGASKCQICHKTEKQGMQYPLWQKSKHSTSAEALNKPEASEIAQQACVDNPAASPKCLTCHAPLFEKAAELKTEGVTCEVCHGPGSEYKKLSVMKDKALAVQNGLITYDSQDAIKKQCLTCHEKAHGKSFYFAAAWEKIKHAVPQEK